MSAFLDAEDLERLTLRKQKSKQIEWLRTTGIPFHIGATGHPVVLWSSIDRSIKREVNEIKTWRPQVLEHA